MTKIIKLNVSEEIKNIPLLKKCSVSISHKFIAILAYLYMIVPIIIFLIGWLKPLIGIGLSGLLLCGFLFLINNEYDSNESFEIDILSLIILFAVAGIWVYTSGVGGFWPQREDWHWRNAILRDLIDYSWPVVYPETGNSLVYYYNFFLLPALIGKLFGWSAANICMNIYTWVGVCISMLLICKILKLKSYRRIAVLALVFVTWSGMEALRLPLFNVLGLNGVIGYQYSSNNTLIQWVTNQTIVPWIAVPLFWDKRKVSTYIFLGMCVLASSPLPFVGMFVILVVDGISQLINQYDKRIKNWIKDIFSVQNISALFTVFIIYALFFSCNTASNGNTGEGGFGLYVPLESFTYKNAISLISFLFFNFIIYSIVVYKNNKNDVLYWTMNISLLLIPLFKIGIGNDFGMRVCIPAQFVLMIYTIKFLTYDSINIKNIRYILIWGCIAIATFNIYIEWMGRLDTVRNTEAKEVLWDDGIYTFSNKINDGYYCGMKPINFLCESPDDTIFFSKLCKDKKEEDVRNDLAVTTAYMNDNNFILMSGEYVISPISNTQLSLCYEEGQLKLGKENQTITISDSTISGKYELFFSNLNKVWNYSEEHNELIFAEWGGQQVWGTPAIPEIQLFQVEQIGDAYAVIWNNTYALTCIDGNISWTQKDYSDVQLWNLSQR